MAKKCKCPVKKKLMGLKKGMILDGKVIDKISSWKLYYDMEVEKVCGHYDPAQKVNKVLMAALDELMPAYINKPQWVEERKAMLIVFK